MRMDRLLDVRKIFDSVSEIWLLLDKNGMVLLTSRHIDKFQHLLPAAVVPGKCVFESIPENWRTTGANVLQTLQHASIPSVFEISWSDSNQNETHYEIKCTGIRNECDSLEEIFIEARDITPQKVFEKKITVIARDYQSVIENANAVIIGTDAGGYVTEWNEMAKQVTGFSRNESYIRKLVDFLSPDAQELFLEAMKKILAGHVISNYEMSLRSKDERKLILLTNGTPRTNAAGEVTGILLIGQDITELTTYRQSLEQKVRERTNALRSALENEKKLVEVKDRFVSMASHEFRSPISYIHRNIAVIKDHLDTLSVGEVRQRLLKVQAHAELLTSLLEDVLTMGKAGANVNRIEAHLTAVSLRDFFNRIIDEVHTNTHNTHRIELDFPFSNIVLKCDESLLRNIFVNLLTNAIKFSPGKNLVMLSIGKCEQQVLVKVQDFGLGIGETDLSRIFEPFHRGQNVQNIKGTGLGLPIVKKAVEALGGEVEVESRPGRGTTFTVKLNLHHP